mgnify:FL=1
MLDQKVVLSTKKDQILIIEWEVFLMEAEQNCSYDRVVITEVVSNNSLKLLVYCIQQSEIPLLLSEVVLLTKP